MICLAATFGPAYAALMPTSYDMLNGNGTASSGTFNYWDLSYNGAGQTNVDNAPLSGGLGDLADLLLSASNWNEVENLAGTGPYVGWTIDPTINFHFSGSQVIDEIWMYVDDSDGFGNVNLPDSVTINGVLHDVDQNAANPLPKLLMFSGLGLNTNQVDITIKRSDTWVMVSEVMFNPVPEPSGIAALGLGALAFAKRRRAKKYRLKNLFIFQE